MVCVWSSFGVSIELCPTSEEQLAFPVLEAELSETSRYLEGTTTGD
jgi:hypothetical protein